jgi:hypothetical protein
MSPVGRPHMSQKSLLEVLKMSKHYGARVPLA